MKGSRISKLVLDSHGSYLGMEKGCFVVKDKHGNSERYPLFENEIGEVILKSGNAVSTGALASLGFWDIDVVVLTGRGRPVAMLKSFDDDSHVETRVSQYEALTNGEGIQIAKQFVIGKLEGQNTVLRKHGLREHDPRSRYEVEKINSKSLKTVRSKLLPIEGRYTKSYFEQIFQLLPEKLRPKSRKKFRAYDGINNTFNLAYEVLSWKVHRALVKAKLEPYLGFLHSTAYSKPSLVCDFLELYRYLVEDFLIGFCRDLKVGDFVVKSEWASGKKNRKGKRQYLNDRKTREMLKRLNRYLEGMVDVPRIRMGNRQTIETLINEEALLLAKFLRDQQGSWAPRTVDLR
ncbi:MAG: CRISPR-associated endonuclease Cas1, partial [Candidatus Bathyarchaeia archaeon]